MPGIVFVFLALFTSIVSTVIKKPILKKDTVHDANAYSMISVLLGGIFALTLYLFTAFHLNDFSAFLNPAFDMFLLLDILCWALGGLLFYPAYKHLPVSESTVFITLEGVFAFVLGIVLFKTETFHLMRFFGCLFILASVILINNIKGWKWDTHTLLLLASTALFGLAIVLDNLLISHNYFTAPVFLQIWNFGLTGVAMILLLPKKLSKFPTILFHKNALFTVIINSFSTFLSFLLVYTAYQKGIVASQANLILASQTAIVIILGMLLFKEKGSLKQRLFSALIATIGVYLLS